MKRKTALRISAALLSAGFVISTVNGSTGRIALAEELTILEDEENLADTEAENPKEQEMTELQNLGEESDNQEAEEPETDVVIEETEVNLEEETETSQEETELPLEDVMEIQLPQKSVQVRNSDFLPVQEEETDTVLNLYEDVYLLYIKSEQGKVNTFYFNQPLNDSDIVLYHFNSENNTATDKVSGQNDISLLEEGSVLSLNLEEVSEYVLVISNGNNYENLAYTLRNEAVQSDETEDMTKQDAEPETETETETESEVTLESETETESETTSESETQEATLVSVKLNLDQDLKTVPTVFSEYLDNLDTYTVTLVYTDGSESILDQTDERYTLSVYYEDVEQDAGAIRRTYYATVEEHSTGKQFEDTQYIELGKEEPVEIKTEEMTSVILEGKKKWIVVQSTPGVTGRYAMNSDKLIKNIYYISEEGEAVHAEDAFQLQEGVTYQFLIELK